MHLFKRVTLTWSKNIHRFGANTLLTFCPSTNTNYFVYFSNHLSICKHIDKNNLFKKLTHLHFLIHSTCLWHTYIRGFRIAMSHRPSAVFSLSPKSLWNCSWRSRARCTYTPWVFGFFVITQYQRGGINCITNLLCVMAMTTNKPQNCLQHQEEWGGRCKTLHCPSVHIVKSVLKDRDIDEKIILSSILGLTLNHLTHHFFQCNAEKYDGENYENWKKKESWVVL